MTRIGLDTNILVYLAGVDRGDGDAAKIDRTRRLLEDLSLRATFVAPTQTLGELFAVLTRLGWSREEAREMAVRFQSTFEIADAGQSAMLSAMDLAVTAQLQIWDALIVNAAAEAGCAILLTEDMQEGFVWRGMTLVNPLAERMHQALAGLMG